ncbi:MAG TPA: hypothetical protein VL793_06485, partial [Patescibacteria group bacterium]|nr:hypothetical protein [Patescibacteria group bacterium]
MQKPRSKAESLSSVWTKAIRKSADPHRVKHYLSLLRESVAAEELKGASVEQARILAAIFSGSEALSSLLISQPVWLEIVRPEALTYPRRKQGLRQERDTWFNPMLASGDFEGALGRLRELKTREMLRIGARDLARQAPVTEIVREISDLADVCLDGVWRTCTVQMEHRYGKPYHRDLNGQWQATTACVLGMGKLGGQELNYSSDVDVLFVHSEEGEVFRNDPSGSRSAAFRGRTSEGATKPVLANHQFFNRLAEAFIAEIAHLGPQGALYRIDLRLRPEGDAGPLSRSVASYENYYAQWGQTWERMMLIKARCVAGHEGLAAEFLETVHPFRYPRTVNENVLLEVGAMKDRIETEVIRADELDRNVKLGRGGIREIEFIAQSLQLLHAGRQPFLQGSQTLPALEKLSQYELLSSQASGELREAYCFLRNVEHRLQMENNQQTHTIPADEKAQERLARLMGFAAIKPFESARRAHSKRVRSIFENVLRREVPETSRSSSLPRRFDGAEDDWKRVLAQHGFKDTDKAFRMLREFVEGPGYVHVSPRTSELALRLLPRMFELCCPADTKTESPIQKVAGDPELEAETAKKRVDDRELFAFQPSEFGARQRRSADAPRGPLSDPDRVITRLDNFIGVYGARATLFELWNSNPAIFDLLLLLFDRSEFLAELAIRTPDLVDELVSSGRLRQRKTAEETLRDLQHGLEDQDQKLWLRRYHQAELMRIGLRDILGVADYEQYLTELSTLADACLRYALAAVLHKHKIKTAPFVIIGLGKLGGAEIDYGSDLDILFVADNKAKNLGKLKALALEILELLSTRTEQGLVFHTDARLRPDGEKGLLVNTLSAYEEYYRRRAMLWEIQTLTRARPVAGDLKVGEQF